MEMATDNLEIETQTSYDVIIAGGGLAGLCTAILLAHRGYSVAVFEKKKYPFHRVCGEYLSLETKGFFDFAGIDLDAAGAKRISQLNITTTGGQSFNSALPLGAWGISRYELDFLLMKAARNAGVEVFEQNPIRDVRREENRFLVKTEFGLIRTRQFIGCHGKRDILDKNLHRSFLKERTGFMAVKYHVKSSFADQQIGLYTFPGGYAGIVNVEGGKTCICYLMKRENMKGFRTVHEMEKEVLYRNQHLAVLFETSAQQYEHPLVINEISFSNKGLTENGIFFTGDSAAMIAPVCGNGMAMSIGGSIILASAVESALQGNPDAEANYVRAWKKQFATRIATGKIIQSVLLNESLCGKILPVMNFFKPLSGRLISLTHGDSLSFAGLLGTQD